jgi:hypothetical protein
MRITEAEAAIIADAYLLRSAERDRPFWFAVPDELRKEAYRLTFKTGHLNRRRTDRHLVYRLSDEALIAQELHQLTQNTSWN